MKQGEVDGTCLKQKPVAISVRLGSFPVFYLPLNLKQSSCTIMDKSPDLQLSPMWTCLQGLHHGPRRSPCICCCAAYA
eukprot:1112101-Pelagomonas_calceolata.AAC.2